jgi:tRNA/rRNA methyltransferase
MTLHLVLVEPAGPLNVGSVARLCANYGLAGLRLVAPRCDPMGEEARRMAVHGLTVLETARTYPTLASALADCRRVVATSGRGEGEPLPLDPPERALAWLQAAPVGEPSALVFGREDRGLANDELRQAGRLLHIPTGSSYGSLNLSHAVAVVLHEWRSLQREGSAVAEGAPPPEPAPRAVLEATLADAEALLLEVGFLHPHTARARMAKLRTLLQRAQPGSNEVALLRGMVAQLRWASRRALPIDATPSVGTSPPPLPPP